MLFHFFFVVLLVVWALRSISCTVGITLAERGLTRNDGN